MESSVLKRGLLATSLLVAMLSRAAATESLAWPVDKFDVAWDSPSPDAKGSMPLGNGDIALNAWVEPDGDLILLLAKSDAFDDFNRLLKLGRIRIRTTPALAQAGQPFAQVLRLSDGLIEIKTGGANLRVWVVMELTVTPNSRRKDVEMGVPDGQPQSELIGARDAQ